MLNTHTYMHMCRWLHGTFDCVGGFCGQTSNNDENIIIIIVSGKNRNSRSSSSSLYISHTRQRCDDARPFVKTENNRARNARKGTRCLAAIRTYGFCSNVRQMFDGSFGFGDGGGDLYGVKRNDGSVFLSTCLKCSTSRLHRLHASRSKSIRIRRARKSFSRVESRCTYKYYVCMFIYVVTVKQSARS